MNIMEKNAIVINDTISKAVDELKKSNVFGCLNSYVINYSDINYISAVALLVRKHDEIDKFNLTVTHAIEACIDSLVSCPESDYEIEYKNIFALSSIGLRSTLGDMGYVSPVAFALYILEEDAIYQHYKRINSQSITIDNGGKSGIGSSGNVKSVESLHI